MTRQILDATPRGLSSVRPHAHSLYGGIGRTSLAGAAISRTSTAANATALFAQHIARKESESAATTRGTFMTTSSRPPRNREAVKFQREQKLFSFTSIPKYRLSPAGGKSLASCD